MDLKIREAQKKILGVFSKFAKSFALSGGTALELYYLHHRFSADLDFFSPKYNISEIEKLVSAFQKVVGTNMNLKEELSVEGKARVRFYIASVKGTKRPLKIDFVEDVVVLKPRIRKFKGVRVYDVENIYLQKIVAIAGLKPELDEIGRSISKGRREARDVFDIYMLSKKIEPLHLFLQKVSNHLQRGMIHWYRTFSRQDLKLALLDLDIYEDKFDSKEMLIYLEGEIKKFIEEVLK